MAEFAAAQNGPVDAGAYEDFYVRLRRRIHEHLAGKGRFVKHAELLLLAPDLFHLMVRLVLDPDLPKFERLKLIGMIAYFMSPVDFLPEVLLGPSGYLDDVVGASIVLDSIINAGHGALARRYWAGDRDLLAFLQRTVANAEAIVGRGVLGRLTRRFGRR